MTKPVIGVLALQGDVREHRHALEAVGTEVREVKTAAGLEGLDGIVIPGGESTTMSNLALAFGVLEPLQAAVQAGLPAYGSCAGMIMLADTILDGRPDQRTVGGLDVVVRRNAFGRQVDSFEADLHAPRIAGGAPMRAVFIRAPWVEAVGDGVEVLARVESGPNAGTIVAVQQGNVMATSFHPELTSDHRVHGYFVDLVRQAGHRR